MCLYLIGETIHNIDERFDKMQAAHVMDHGACQFFLWYNSQSITHLKIIEKLHIMSL